MMKKSVLVMLAAAAMVSCSESNNDPIINGEGGTDKIALRSFSPKNTRAPFEGAIGADNELEARIITSYEADLSDIHANGKMVFSSANENAYYDQSTVSELEAQYPLDATTDLYFFGLSPYADWVGTTDTYSLVFNGNEDLMATTEVHHETKTGDVWSISGLTFQHLLTKLVLRVETDNVDEAIAEFGEIQDIVLAADVDGATAVSNEMEVTLDAQGAPVAAVKAAATGNVGFFVVDESVYTDNAFTGQSVAFDEDKHFGTSTVHAYAMVAPITATANITAYYLNVTTSEGTFSGIPVRLYSTETGTDTKPLPYVGSTAGHSFVVTLYFNAEKEFIEANAVEVEAWEDEGEYTVLIRPSDKD